MPRTTKWWSDKKGDGVMYIGVTGTRKGMTQAQEASFREFIADKCGHFLHGDCVGVDDECATIVRKLRTVEEMKIWSFPPDKSSLRAFNKFSDYENPPNHYFARNREIVYQSDILLVIPLQFEWQPSGGTWYTHDYALHQDKKVIVIWPSGDIEEKGNIEERE